MFSDSQMSPHKFNLALSLSLRDGRSRKIHLHPFANNFRRSRTLASLGWTTWRSTGWRNVIQNTLPRPRVPTQKGTQSRNTTNKTVHKFNHLRANMIRSDHTWKQTNIREHIRNYMKLYEHIMYHYVDIVCIYVAMMITCIYTVTICYNHIHTVHVWTSFGVILKKKSAIYQHISQDILHPLDAVSSFAGVGFIAGNWNLGKWS